MYKTEWEVKVKISGGFQFFKEEKIKANTTPIAGMKKLRLVPDKDDQGKQLETNTLELTLDMPVPKGRDEHEFIMDFSVESINHLIAKLSLSAGQQIQQLTAISVTQFHSIKLNEYRHISQMAAQSILPKTFISSDLLLASTEDYLNRAIFWWSQTIKINDLSECLQALFVCIDLLAAKIIPESSVKRKCKNCKYEETLLPSLRAKFIYLLNNNFKFGLEPAKELWEIRNDITHGRANITEADKRIYRNHATNLIVATRNEIALRMNCTLSPMPTQLPFDTHSAHIVFDYTMPK